MSDVRRLIRLMRPHTRWIVLGVLLSLVTVLANMGLLALSSWFVASMAVAGISGSFFNYTLPAAGIRALALGRTGGRYLERLTNHNVTLRVLAELRVAFYRRLQPLSPSVLAAYRSGDLLSRIRADVDVLDDFYVRGFVPIVVAVIGSTLAVLFLTRFSLMIAAVDLFYLLAVGVALPALVSVLSRRPGAELVETASKLRAALVAYKQGTGELLALGCIDAYTAEIENLSRHHSSIERRLSAILGLSDAMVLLGMLLALWSGLIAAVQMAIAGHIAGPSVALIGVFLLASFELVMPVPEVARRYGSIKRAARRLFEIGTDEEQGEGQTSRRVRGDLQADIRRKAPPVDASSHPSSGISPPNLSAPKRVQFRNVHFCYPGSSQPVFSGLDLDIPAGSRVAVVGPTGAGKSTLINLLLRSYEPQSGDILVGGIDIASLSPDEAASLVSIADQNFHLFQTTIRENLLLGKQDATDAEMLIALDVAQMSDFVASLPAGLETVVGEAGGALSTGQARRVSIARALLKPAPVLILDEPTEGLDGATADALIRAVFVHARPQTLILITHQDFGLDAVDRIVRIRRAT